MQFSKEAVACLVCAFDRLHSHIDNMCKQAQTTGICGNIPGTLILMFCLLLKHKNVHKKKKPKAHCLCYKKLIKCVLFGFYKTSSSYSLGEMWHRPWRLLTACENDSQSDVVSTNITVLEDNLRLRDLTTLLQGKHHKMSMEVWSIVYFSEL